MSHHLLIRERVLLLYPSMAVAFGLNEAIFLQQLAFLMKRDSAEVHDGSRWIQITAAQLQREFPFWSERTVKRIIADLKERDLILVKRGRDGSSYTLNYEAMGQVVPSETGQVGTSATSEWPVGKGQVGTSPSIEGSKEEQGNLFGGEPAAENPEDQEISEVWDLYFSIYGDRIQVKELTAQRKTMIRKGLKAVGGNAEILKNAIRGLKSYRDSHDSKKNVSLDVILKTRPGGDNLTDQIEWWAGQARGDAPGRDPLASVPEVQRAVVRERMFMANRLIQGRPLDPDTLREAQEAIDWLRTNHSLVGTLNTDDRTVKWERQ
jgi:hypothetical protein